MSLFLYLSAENRTILLREARLPFRLVEHLFDPFLTNHAVKEDVPRQVTEQEIDAEILRQYQALPEHLATLVDLEYFREQMQGKRKGLEAAILAREQRADLELPSPVQRQALTLLRLFETPLNPLLWERYADHYRGVVVEIDTKDDIFTKLLYQDKPQLLKPVQYSEERPLQTNPGKFPSLFYRPKEFAAEQEWRLIRPRAVADKTIEREGEELYLHRISPKLFLRMIFGCNMGAEQKKRFVQRLEFDVRYRHIQLQECCVDPYRYEIHIRELSEQQET